MADLTAAARGGPIDIVHASRETDFEPAFAAMVERRAAGLVIGIDTFFNSQSAKLAALALAHRLPAIYQYREFAAAGGLMSLGGSITDAYRIVGTYAGRILEGERPGDLPVQRSTKVEMFVNLETARALGVTIPEAIMIRADEAIE